MNKLSKTDLAKQAAGNAAAAMVKTGWTLGLGTGSTAEFVIVELGRRIREEGASFIGIPTSHSSELLARENGIPIRTIRDVDRIDMAIDGADEVDKDKNLIKGSGGAHTKEKIVDSYADLFVVVVDDSKIKLQLGKSMAVPMEVIPLAIPAVMRDVNQMGGVAVLRMAGGQPGHYGPIITDQGNMILDAKFETIEDPYKLERQLNAIPGVLENGIFSCMNVKILVGSSVDGSVNEL